MIIMVAAAMAGFVAAASDAAPPLPNATLAADARDAPASYAVPVGAWRDGALPTVTAEGAVAKTAWQVPSSGRTTLALIDPLREELRTDGYDILFECRAESCGGFDFRYAVEMLPAPSMHVDLGDYRFISARRPGPDGELRYAAYLVSRAAGTAFIHEVRIAPADGEAPDATIATKSLDSGTGAQDAAGAADGTLAERLRTIGRAPLTGVGFEVGDSRLADDELPALAAVASYLREAEGTRLVLVGHTDASGSPAVNMSLSRQRASAVRQRLIARHAIAPERIDAEGVGYLAPVASNADADGRQRNRRVEAVILNQPS